MIEVKRLSQRLECMLFRAKFADEVAELKPVSEHIQIYNPPLILLKLFFATIFYSL